MDAEGVGEVGRRRGLFEKNGSSKGEKKYSTFFLPNKKDPVPLQSCSEGTGQKKRKAKGKKPVMRLESTSSCEDKEQVH